MSQKPLNPVPASIGLTDSVAKNVSQQVTGGAASIQLADSVATGVDQQVTLTGDAASTAVGRLASIEVKDGVVKEIHQVVNIHLGPGQSLEALLGATRTTARRLYVACGREIRAYSVAGGNVNPDPVETLRLPPDMGSARSVRLASVGQRLVILAGARCGVVAIDTSTGHAQVYRFPRHTRHGANSSVIHGGWLYATHSDFGLLRWSLEGGDAATLIPKATDGGQTVRNIQLDATGRLLLSAGGSVLALGPAAPQSPAAVYRGPAGAELVGIATCGEHVYAAASDGRVLRWDCGIPGAAETIEAGDRVKTYCMSLARLPDGPCLVLGVKDTALRIVRLAPPEATIHYRAPEGSAIRWARAASDLLVATNAECTRVFFWRPEHVDRPLCELAVCHSAPEQITDMCLLAS